MRIFLLSFFTFVILGCAGLVGLFRIGGRDLPSTARLHAISPAEKSEVYDVSGRLIGEFLREDRSLVRLEEVPETLLNAFVAIEDRRFWDHWGIDMLGIARATGRNVTRGSRHGASTITQQLARNLFLTHEQTVSRKLKEAVLALRIEQTYSKEEIMEMYLNKIYFGEGAYGVRAAARNFFDKDLGDLTLGECAMIAGLPRNPRDYSPRRHLDRALRRRSLVLGAMEECAFIDGNQRVAAEAESVSVAQHERVTGRAPYFMEMVRQYLEARFGGDAMYEEGYVVHTTLDLNIQETAEKALEKHLTRLEAESKSKTSRKAFLELAGGSDEPPKPEYLQGAVLVVDPASGAMRAVVGGRDFGESSFNRALQASRQPGSAIKPFVYLAGIEKGFYPSYMIMDSPVVFYEPNQEEWRPRNYDHEYRGPVTLRYALQKSLNVPTVKLQEEVTPEAVIRLARAAGITSPMPPYRSIALGTAEVTLKEITYAYAVFANDGIRVEPIFINRIEDRSGNILEEARTRRSEVLRADSVGLLANMLASVMNEGTGAGARRDGFNLPAGGKTGTTDDYSDAWFLGFTPSVVTGVWVGYDVRKPIGRGMTGTRAALPIWTEVMKKATEGDEPLARTMPEGVIEVEVCSDTGLPATEDCPTPTAEFFLTGQVPADHCYLHGAFMDLRLRDRWESNQDRSGWDENGEEP